MKNPSSCFGVILLLLSVALIVPGCASSQSGTYPTLKQTEMNVSWPMTRYRNGVAAGAVTQGEQEQVRAAYAKYQAAFKEAVDAAHGNYQATTPDNVKALANEVTRIISSIPF